MNNYLTKYFRVIEHVFERLVQWAAAAIETSSNQPVLPHAIIALNASEHDLDDNRWDVLDSTESILHDLGQTVNYNVTFKKLAQFWRERGKAINSLVDLILCYYSSIQASSRAPKQPGRLSRPLMWFRSSVYPLKVVPS